MHRLQGCERLNRRTLRPLRSPENENKNGNTSQRSHSMASFDPWIRILGADGPAAIDRETRRPIRPRKGIGLFCVNPRPPPRIHHLFVTHPLDTNSFVSRFLPKNETLRGLYLIHERQRPRTSSQSIPFLRARRTTIKKPEGRFALEKMGIHCAKPGRLFGSIACL